MRMRLKIVTGSVLLLSVIACSYLYAQSSDGFAELVNGKYPVGFQLLEKIDYSRPGWDVVGSQDRSYSEPGRKIRMYLWYPAMSTSGKSSMLFEDYVLLAAEDFKSIDGNEKAKMLEARKNLPFARAVSEDQWESLMKQKVKAVEGAQPSSDTFPLIVLGQGLYYENPVTHFFLCEYLASHGYVVVTSPLIGAHSRLVRLNLVDLEAQVRDMEFVMAEASQLPSVDKDKLGVIGFDLGGMSGLLLQMRNPRVDALVTMDSGIVFRHPSGLPGSSFHYNVDRFNVPWLHMTQKRAVDPEGLHSDISLFHKAKYSDISLVVFDGISHVNFTSYSLLGINKPLLAYWSTLGNQPKNTYMMVCKTINEFLNAHLKNDKEDLKSFDNLLSRYSGSGISITMEQKKAELAPPSVDGFVDKILSNGVESAIELMKSYKANNPDWPFYDEATLNYLGYKFLLFWDDGKTALRIFNLMVEYYPESANAYDSLAECCMLLGDKEKAIANYKKSLELNPNNDNAREKLEQLEQ